MDQREYLAAVAEKLSPEMSGDDVQELLYSAAVERELKPKKAFAAVYTVSLGKKSGPAGPSSPGCCSRWSVRGSTRMEDTNTVRGAR